MNARIASFGRDFGEFCADAGQLLAPLAFAYFACRGLPWIIGVMAQ